MLTQSVADELFYYLGWRANDRRCMIGASALLCFDFALTFPAEVRHIWKRRFTISTSLYLVLRYSMLVQQVLYSVENLLPATALTDKGCVIVLRTIDLTAWMWECAVCAFAVLSVYGVWGRDWKALAVVLIFGLTELAVEVVQMATVTYRKSGLPPLARCEGVLERDISPLVMNRLNLLEDFIPGTLYGIAVCLAWIKSLSIKRNAQILERPMPLVDLIRRSATLFYFVYISMGILSFVSGETQKTDSGITMLLSFWGWFEPVLSTIFISRIMLELRSVYSPQSDDYGDDSITLSQSEPSTPGYSRAGSAPIRVPLVAIRSVQTIE